MNRDEMLKRAGETRSKPWDIVIIGGGATGLGIAVDAASRGYETLLVETRGQAAAPTGVQSRLEGQRTAAGSRSSNTSSLTNCPARKRPAISSGVICISYSQPSQLNLKPREPAFTCLSQASPAARTGR